MEKGRSSPQVEAKSYQAMAEALYKVTSGQDSLFPRLGEIQQPVLVANGSNDIMIPTINSFVMAQRLPNAQLMIYPDSGHGFLFQYAELFSEHLSLFLR